jgi:hypothetical protein
MTAADEMARLRRDEVDVARARKVLEDLDAWADHGGQLDLGQALGRSMAALRAMLDVVDRRCEL